jgi:hypothetical protein
VNLNAELLHMLDEEELYWYRGCNETWLLKGDNNTSFFHRVASGQRRKQTIFSLQDGSTTIKGNDNHLAHATQYYKVLFGPGDGNAFEPDLDLWTAEVLVNEQEKFDLTKPFSKEEIQNALLQMENNKATSHDGLPIKFYQACWPVIKGDMLKLFDGFYLGHMDIKSKLWHYYPSPKN